ncbi:M20 family metallopeptidase [Planotetraspora sp. A-T 1434]|uniref:M20 metallopeptidase family protein n=1 Tax=Planotetraspora sp. A-T 1434 TaxID=2979219 RepID=UPI0021C1CCD7|nr:M20 family metallopeptidase [Planotetraspora sp. A-T 1434]MCT9929973.1 M20 family metallopeptidase [Planotetraspora sp. A-T 1434]
MTFQDELVELRRALHREPEVGLHLPRTQEKVLGALGGLPLEITTGERLSSVTAVLRGSRPVSRLGPTVLLRADMDALPVHEKADVPYRSALDGRMHACGHDLHMSMLVGAARLLADRRAELAGDVVFMFQPGEEGQEGAKIMIEEGVLDASGSRPVAAYGMHVFSTTIPRGLFLTRSGPVLAAADTLTVTVRGRGGHGSSPHRALDPIPAACEIVTALQTHVTRTFDVFDPVVVTVGSFHAGTTDNVIPDEARFETTIRTFSAQSRDRVRDGAVRLARGIGEAHGLTVECEFGIGYPVTVNDRAEADFAAETVREALGEDRFFPMPHPATGSEDFSFVLEEVPGAFLVVGACPPGHDLAAAPSNHSAGAVFDDEILSDGATLFTELAVRRLAAAAR